MPRDAVETIEPPKQATQSVVVQRSAVRVERSSEILAGVPEIAGFLGINVKTVTALIREGLPVTRLGLRAATTRGLLLAWLERRACGDV